VCKKRKHTNGAHYRRRRRIFVAGFAWRVDFGSFARRIFFTVAAEFTLRLLGPLLPAWRLSSATSCASSIRSATRKTARRFPMAIFVESGLVFRNAVGRIGIVVTPAPDLGLAGHRRGRALRQAHAARRGQYFGTLIHHARGGRCAFAQLAIAIAMIVTAIRGRLVGRARRANLRVARRLTAVVAAVRLPAVAAAADREQLQATRASLESKQQLAVHRSPTVTTTNLPTAPTTSIVCSQPASIG
jgi:hypothetical protein